MFILDLISQTPAFLAPMSGITDLPYRKLVYQLGGKLVVSEMTACKLLMNKDKKMVQKTEHAGFSPHIVQLAGYDPYWMSIGAKIATEKSGADMIDINMGCPSKRVTGGFAGSALMKDLDHAERLVEAVISSVDKPVTLKMRLGWDHQNLNAIQLAKRAEKIGVQAVFIHARTRQQFYKGKADWSAVTEISTALKIPVIINGDIGSITEASESMKVSRAKAVMIGRSAIGKPWIISQISDFLSNTELKTRKSILLKDLVYEHYEHMLDYYGVFKGVRMARKHLASYIEHIPLDKSSLEDQKEERKQIRSKLCKEESPLIVKRDIKAYFDFSILI